MTTRTPLRALFDESGNVTALAEFQSGDTLPAGVLPGGSVAAHVAATDPHPQYLPSTFDVDLATAYATAKL